MTAGDVELATSSSSSDSHVSVTASRPTVVPDASASPPVPLGRAKHRREMPVADAGMPVPAVNEAAAAFVVPEAGVLGAAANVQTPASNAATASCLVSEAGTLGGAPGIQVPAVNAGAAAAVEALAALVNQGPPINAAASAGQALLPDGGSDMHVVNAAAAAAAADPLQAAVLPDLDPAHDLPPLNTAAAAPQAGLLLPNPAAPVDSNPPNRTLVNPSGTGRVPFVIRWHAPGACGVKLSEQHQPSCTSREASSCGVPRLQDMSRAVVLSSLVESPEPGNSLFDLLPFVNLTTHKTLRKIPVIAPSLFQSV